MICKTKDLSKAFEILKIMLDLETNLNLNSSFAQAIKFCIDKRQPPMEIFQMVKDQVNEGNRVDVEIAIGRSVTDKIMYYEIIS